MRRTCMRAEKVTQAPPERARKCVVRTVPCTPKAEEEHGVNTDEELALRVFGLRLRVFRA